MAAGGEHELGFGSRAHAPDELRTAVQGRACWGRGGQGRGWARRAACRGRARGSGLGAPGSRLQAALSRRAGRGAGAACGGGGVGACGRRVGACREGAGAHSCSERPPTARSAEPGGGGAAAAPCGPAPAQSREQQVKPVRRQRAPSLSAVFPPAAHRPPLPSSAPSCCRFPDASSRGLLSL